MTLSPIRKVFQGIADRRQMHRMFDRHAQRPNRWENDDSALYRGEWFEIGQAEHDTMFEILPPLWMRGDMFAMREFLTGSITSVFFALTIDARPCFFHGYCDLSDRVSPECMRAAIVERESRPVKAMTRAERLEHIWSSTHDDYRGYAGEAFAEPSARYAYCAVLRRPAWHGAEAARPAHRRGDLGEAARCICATSPTRSQREEDVVTDYHSPTVVQPNIPAADLTPLEPADPRARLRHRERRRRRLFPFLVRAERCRHPLGRRSACGA